MLNYPRFFSRKCRWELGNCLQRMNSTTDYLKFINLNFEMHEFYQFVFLDSILLTDSNIYSYGQWTFSYIRSLNKSYENEVTLREQKLPLKCCQLTELLIYIERGFRSFHTFDIGSVDQKAANLLSIKL